MPVPPPPRTKRAPQGPPQPAQQAKQADPTDALRRRARKLYAALSDRWKELAVLGSFVYEGERKTALNTLRDANHATSEEDAQHAVKELTRLGQAASARIAWEKLRKEYAETKTYLAKRFFLETDNGIRANYGLPPTDLEVYKAAYEKIMALIKERIDNELYAEYLEVQYMAKAYDWLSAGLWSLWRDENYANTTELEMNLEEMDIEELFDFYQKVEIRGKETSYSTD